MKKTMIKSIVLGAAVLLLSCTSLIAENPKVELQTTLGSVIIELYPDKAPKTVENFLAYVDEKGYDGTIFHRVMSNFMIQGGGFTKEMKKTPVRPAIINEAYNGLKNTRGTIAMARTSDVHSATNQFFINVVNNRSLNYRSQTPAGYGYCVFGSVTKGMDVVDKIRNVKTVTKYPYANVPETPVMITSVRRVQEKTK